MEKEKHYCRVFRGSQSEHPAGQAGCQMFQLPTQ